jgi:hypothetical protein
MLAGNGKEHFFHSGYVVLAGLLGCAWNKSAQQRGLQRVTREV